MVHLQGNNVEKVLQIFIIWGMAIYLGAYNKFNTISARKENVNGIRPFYSTERVFFASNML